MKLFQSIIERKRGTKNKGDDWGTSVRIAIYDSLIAPPRVVSLAEDETGKLIERLAAKTYNLSKEKGGSIPYTVIKEVIENLIHAFFKQAVVSILDEGNTIKISDQGPGIENKDAAFLPGFTTATTEMKRCIRGVGSGLPVANEVMAFSGGQIEIKDNLSRGTVVTLSAKKEVADTRGLFPSPIAKLGKRQVQVLSLVTEAGAAGPSAISNELKMSLSTAHRELICLEDLGLIKSDSQGKRRVTREGIDCLSKIINSQKGASF